MNTKLFSDAMNEIDSKYYEEAMTELQPDRLHLKWWKLHKAAACFAAVMLMGVLSFIMVPRKQTTTFKIIVNMVS